MVFIQIIVLILLVYIIYLLLYSMIGGAPYAALSHNRIVTMYKLLKPKKGRRFLDLGSGDGRVVKYFAKKGVDSYGIEINPLIYVVSKFNTRGIKKSHIKLGDYWGEDFSKYDYISLWVVPHTMPRLEKKLKKELKKGSLVVSNHLQFKKWKYEVVENDVYLYRKN